MGHGLCVFTVRFSKDIPNPPVSRKRESEILDLEKQSFDDSHIFAVKSLWLHDMTKRVCFVCFDYCHISISLKPNTLCKCQDFCVMLFCI